MYLDKIKRILNAAIAKILCVFGWIYDLAMRILNAVNKTTQQSKAIKKVIGGLIMIAVPAILKLLGVS